MQNFIAERERKLVKLCLEQIEDISYSEIMKLLREKDVKVNGKRVNKDILLSVGDKVEVYRKAKKEINSSKKFVVRYKDENVIVIDKKSGFTSEEIFSSLEETENAKFIHRLDRNTAGIMIFALNTDSEKELLKGFKDRTFDKKYKALIFGKPKKDEDVLTAYLIKDENDKRVFISDKALKGAVRIKTGYKVVKEYPNFSEIEVTLYTGKTHQIRAHMAYMGNPVIGDGKYGKNTDNKKFGVNRQQLLSYKLTLFFDKNSPLYYLNGKIFVSEEKFDIAGIE